MAPIPKSPKNTHVSIRSRRPDRSSVRVMTRIVQRAPIRASSYSAGERFMIVELMIFFLVDREIVGERDVQHLVKSNLEVQKCSTLLNIGADKPRVGRPVSRLLVSDVWRRLTELQLLKTADGRKLNSPASITPKGMRHIKKQSKKLQLCAQKLVYTDLLDKLARAVS